MQTLLPGIFVFGYWPPMRLFLYGTLLDHRTLATRSGDPALPARCVAATLLGWRRVEARHSRYPTLRRHPAGAVVGAVVDAGAAAMTRLTAYEGDAYRLRRFVVSTMRGKIAAYAWIAPGGSRRPWKE